MLNHHFLQQIIQYLDNTKFRLWAIVFYFLFFFCIPKADAQTICFFEKDSIEVKNGQSITNKLHVENAFDTPLILIKKSKDSLAIIALPDTIKLQPKEKRTFFIKYLATTQLFQNVGNHITVSYINTDGTDSSVNQHFILFSKTNNRFIYHLHRPSFI